MKREASRWAAIAALSMAASSAAAAEPVDVVAWLAQPGVRLVVVRAGGADHRWRDFPARAGLVFKALRECRSPSADTVICDPSGIERRRLKLAPGEAAVWDWRGRRIAAATDADAVRRLIGRHLGPQRRVWLDAPDQRDAWITALGNTGRWRVTHSIDDVRAVRAAPPLRADADPCDDDRAVPALTVLKVTAGGAAWLDLDGCRWVDATGEQPAQLVAMLEAEWRRAGRERSVPGPGTAHGRPVPGRRADRHHVAAVTRSRAALDAIGAKAEHGPLLDAVRPWLGVPYLRNGTTARGIDDFNLVRRLYRDVYGIELSANPLDWLTAYAKVPIDESAPEETVQRGDILFKVTLAYRPREVVLYLGGGKVLTAKDVVGVTIDKVPKNLSFKYYLVARRPLAGPLAE